MVVPSCVCAPPVGADPGRGLQAVRASGAAPAPSKPGYPQVPEPRPDLVVPLTPEPQGLGLAQYLADLLQQDLVRQHRLAAPALHLHRSLGSCLPCIVSGTGRAPQPAHPGLAIDTTSGDRAGPAHGFDLRFGKGNSPSCRAMRISSSSLSIIRFPSSRLARLSSLVFRAVTFESSVRLRVATSPTRNSFRQSDSTADGWPVSRLSAPRLSPRRSRNTTSCLHFADHRFTDDFLLMDTSCRSYSTTKYVPRIFEGQPTTTILRTLQGSLIVDKRSVYVKAAKLQRAGPQ